MARHADHCTIIAMHIYIDPRTPLQICIPRLQAQKQFIACYDVVETLGDCVCGSLVAGVSWCTRHHSGKHLAPATPTVCQHTKSRALPYHCHCLPLIACFDPVQLQGTLSLLPNLLLRLLLAAICTEHSSHNHGLLLAQSSLHQKSRVSRF